MSTTSSLINGSSSTSRMRARVGGAGDWLPGVDIACISCDYRRAIPGPRCQRRRIVYLPDVSRPTRLKLSAAAPKPEASALQFHSARRRVLRGPDELHHVAVRVFDEDLPETRRA